MKGLNRDTFLLITPIDAANFEQAMSQQIVAQMTTNAEATAEGIAKDVAAIKAKVEFIAMDSRIKSEDLAGIVVRLAEIKQTQATIETLFYAELNGNF